MTWTATGQEAKTPEPPERELGLVAYHVPDSSFEPLPEEEIAAWEA